MKAIIPNICIRGREVRENKKGGKYLLVRFEDESGAAYHLVDKEMDREKFYVRDAVGNLVIDIISGRDRAGNNYTNIRIIDFKTEVR